MGRKALLIAGVIGLVVIIAGLILFFGRRESAPQTEQQNTEGITVSTSPNSWQIVTSGPLGLSVEVPPAWWVDHVDGDIEAILGDSESQSLGVGAEFVIYSYENPDNLTPEDWLKQEDISGFSKIIKNGKEGVSYETKIIEKYYSNGRPQSRFIDDSYLLVNIFFADAKIIEVNCTLSGPNYKTMIPTCEKIIGSLQFRE